MEANNLSNLKPILYLGKDRVNGAYYFLGDKDGVGRFLKFLVYPMWCTGNMIGNFLDIGADVPSEILAEIMLFINGVVNYELLPAKRGRAETVVRTDLATGITRRSPTKTTGTEGQIQKPQKTTSGTVEESGISREPCRDGTEIAKVGTFGNFGSGRCILRPPVSDEKSRNVSGRRSSGNSRVLDKSGNLPLAQQSEATTVQADTGSQTKTLASVNEEQPVKKRRGRPPKVKPLD